MSELVIRTALEMTDTRRARSFPLVEGAFRAACAFFAVLVLIILGGVIVALVDGAMPAFRRFGFEFLTTRSEERRVGKECRL